MNKPLLVLLCLLVTSPGVANDLKKEVEELYRPADAQTMKLLTSIPLRASRAKRATAGQPQSNAPRGGGDCPHTINIGSVQGEQNHIWRFDATVVISEPLVINCGR